MVDDIHRDEQFTDGLDEAIRLARTAHRKYQTKSDATQLETTLRAFADIADHTRDLLGVADDHQARSQGLDGMNFDDLLEQVTKAGHRLDTYPEEAPICLTSAPPEQTESIS